MSHIEMRTILAILVLNDTRVHVSAHVWLIANAFGDFFVRQDKDFNKQEFLLYIYHNKIPIAFFI